MSPPNKSVLLAQTDPRCGSAESPPPMVLFPDDVWEQIKWMRPRRSPTAHVMRQWLSSPRVSVDRRGCWTIWRRRIPGVRALCPYCGRRSVPIVLTITTFDDVDDLIEFETMIS